MHIMRPVAGRMRRKTRSSGILRTKRRRPLKTSRLTKMFVPKPKKAFQSPGVQIDGFLAIIVVSPSVESSEHSFRIRHPAEDAALGLDHAQRDLVKFGKVRSAAVARDDAAVTAVVRLANRGVHAHLGR